MAFEPWHVAALDLQPHQSGRGFQDVGAEALAMLADAGPCRTILRDGEPFFCGGARLHYPGRAEMWALLNYDVEPRGMVVIHKRTLDFLDAIQDDPCFRRIEATVRPSFDAGRRWFRALGFHFEGLMRCYDLQGHDHELYSRIR